MSDTTFVNGTPIVPDWLNDVNDHVYNTADVVNVRLPPYNAVGDGTTDDTSAIQAAIAAAESASAGVAKKVYLPAGKYKITSPLVITKEYSVIAGDGPWSSQILFNGVSSGITTSAINYIRPLWRDFGIIGDATSGYGINLNNLNKTPIVGQCYLGEFSNIVIYSGNTCFYAPGATNNPQFFSNVVRNVSCYSYNGHSFHIWSGPGNTFQSLYALRAAAGKAGYRMAGTVTLLACNGLNDGDVWGAFGSEPTGSDGFQGDFGSNDYIELVMIGCNVERFGSLTAGAGIGIRICNVYRTVNIIGGTLQRADDFASEGKPTLVGANSYKALISTRYGPNATGNPIRIGFGAIYLRDVINGTGTNTPSQAHLYAENTGHFEDTTRICFAANITSYRVAADGPLDYPVLSNSLANDIYAGWAYQPHAMSPRRLSVQHLRYTTGAALTPVGVNQAINVTGKTKVIVTPAAAASISTATFTATAGDSATDYGRNGDLIIEAGNANLTIVHSASGSNTFKLSGGANLTLAAGEIVRFTRSEAGGNWWQVGGAGGGGLSQSITNTDISSVVIETPSTIATVLFTTASHWGQQVGGFASGFGLMTVQGSGSAGSFGSWSVAAPFTTGWSVGWSDVAVGFWSAEDASVSGQIVKQAGTGKLLFFCTTTSALIAAPKQCRFHYMFRVF